LHISIAELIAVLGHSALRTGELKPALDVLEETLADEVDPAMRAWLLCAACAVLAVRGEPVDDRLGEMRRMVGDSSDPQLRGNVVSADAFLAFAAGNLDQARTSWLLSASLTAFQVPTSLARAARAALWAGDGPAARNDLAALDASGFHGLAIEADRATIRAGLASLEGNPNDALSIYREALRTWDDLSLAWDAALCGLDMATLLDPARPEVKAAAESAREILVRLEAAPFIARLDAVMARTSDPDGLQNASATTPPASSAMPR
jgi:tetratricopeptide (TPR) repeat protein